MVINTTRSFKNKNLVNFRTVRPFSSLLLSEVIVATQKKLNEKTLSKKPWSSELGGTPLPQEINYYLNRRNFVLRIQNMQLIVKKNLADFAFKKTARSCKSIILQQKFKNLMHKTCNSK